jgi:hypothetical protein
MPYIKKILLVLFGSCGFICEASTIDLIESTRSRFSLQTLRQFEKLTLGISTNPSEISILTEEISKLPRTNAGDKASSSKAINDALPLIHESLTGAIRGKIVVAIFAINENLRPALVEHLLTRHSPDNFLNLLANNAINS